ncbi:MAG: response regulator transcription factor [Sporichthyaceae bacterium]
MPTDAVGFPPFHGGKLRFMRLLLVEDDTGMADMLSQSLRRQGYAVDRAATGQDALWRVNESTYDAVVLDAMIPPPDGFEICRKMRDEGRWVPVIMLTARDAVADRIKGLDSGADDYLTKPFALGELHARLRALVRREPGERPAVLTVNDLVIDPGTREVRRGEVDIALSPKEYALLTEFARRPGEVLSRAHLIEHVWDFAYDGTSNVVDAYVKHLRNKIDRPFGRKTIRTVRSVGYRLDPNC